MLILFLVRLALMALALIYVVPFFTGNRVGLLKGGFGTAFLITLVLSLLNSGLWLVFSLVTVGGALALNALTFGIVGILVNSLGFLLVGKMRPDVLHVSNFYDAFFAAMGMTFASFIINMII